ncbi:hypothetical protein Pla123a_15500 [Posidoniimonas polymericola]|uniref:Uncharacterized protein n=1 Tax=Posidoniimonas polymericola TaxID=2528002 RepID=A0A5C5YRZ7_9BACT|nr:hypothetical protein [Posidoniimonas polymericola]TWT77754.1 hypothetical protein Pla123a_15500 [Posidoniimonas polymericola]
MTYDEDDPESYDFRDDSESDTTEVDEVVQRLRDTLTHDMATKAYRIRFDKEPEDAELEEFMDELVNEHYNAGLDEWTDEYLLLRLRHLTTGCS